MIAGIVACQPLSFPAQEGVPEGALVHLDFINGIYFDGATVTAADVVDHPEWIGVGGLEIRIANETTAGTGIAHVIGDALTALLTNDWTVVVEYEEINAFDSYILFVQDATWADLFQIQQDDDTLHAYEDVSSGSSRVATPSGAYGLGIHRVAVTATATKLVISGDGSAVNADNTARSGTYAPTEATFGGFHGDFIFNEINIRSLTVYTPKSDAVLPSLSA